MKHGLLMYFFMVFVLIGVFTVGVMADVTMYAPDGRTISVQENQVAAWERVGWSTNNTITGAFGSSSSDNVTWFLNFETGELRISGSGRMRNFDFAKSPFAQHQHLIKSVIIDEGVANIGDNAFYECTSIQTVSLPSTLTEIGRYAFYGCTSIQTVSLPSTLTKMDYGVFSGCKLDAIYLPENTSDSISASAFSGIRTINRIYYSGSDWINSAWIKSKELMNAALYYVLYADGGVRSISVPWNEVETYLALGWSYKKDCSQLLYAPDGKSIMILQYQVPDYLAVGWYEHPFITMYALDGRTITVNELEKDAYMSVGWYESYDDVTQDLYSFTDCITVYKSEVPAYLKLGWRNTPYSIFYAPKLVVSKYGYATLYLAIINTSKWEWFTEDTYPTDDSLNIKYIEITLATYNSVGDPAPQSIYPYNTMVSKRLVGPIYNVVYYALLESETDGFSTFDIDLGSYHALDYVIIRSITLEYMDGHKETLYPNTYVYS